MEKPKPTEPRSWRTGVRLSLTSGCHPKVMGAAWELPKVILVRCGLTELAYLDMLMKTFLGHL